MRKEKKSIWGLVITFFIVFIFVSSIIGFIYSGETDSFKYNDLKFKRTQTQWFTTINNQRLTFDYFPSEVEHIELSDDIKITIKNKPEIDTTSDIDDIFLEEISLAQYNMALTLASTNIYVRGGFTANNTYDMSIITCEDATAAIPIIHFKQSNQTKVTLEDNCIIAEARNNIDILRIKDRILYSILDIIE